MIISLSPSTYFYGRKVVSSDWTDDGCKTARMIRTDVALDNSVIVTDSGFSWGDTSMKLNIGYIAEDEAVLKLWLQAWPLLVVCRFDGMFKAALQSVQHKSGRLNVQLAIIERIT